MNLNEKGFTIVEFMVASAIGALIALGGGMTVSQINSISESNIDLTTAIRQAQNVGSWVSQDVLMAQSITIEDDPETADTEFITISRKDWETGETRDIRYVLLDSVDSLKKVKRKQLTNDENGIEIDNRATLIADNIHTANLSWQGGIWILSVEARAGEKISIREFEISQRRQTGGGG